MTLADRLPTAPRVTWHVDAAGLRCSVEWPEGRPPLSRVLPIFERLGLDLVDHVPGEVRDSFGFSEVQDPNPPEMLPLLARGVRRSRAIAAASDGSALLD